MSAAAARRRKQLAARQAGENNDDVVGKKLQDLLEQELDEATAYEALQLAQSQIRKKVGGGQFTEACDLCYTTSLSLLKQQRISVASQLLTLLVEVLRETQQAETPVWIDRLTELQRAHETAMEKEGAKMLAQESQRLHRLQRDWLNLCCLWSSDIGTIKFGANALHHLLASQSWKLSTLLTDDDVNKEEIMDLQCDAVQHMALAEDPMQIAAWLKTLPDPTAEEIKTNHTCAPALRDSLLTRTVLCMAAMQNLRDASTLVREYLNNIEKRTSEELTKSYTSKDDNKAPSHVIFCSMLLRVCEKEPKTGPLFSWLLRSFRKELDVLHKSQMVIGYTGSIGQVYFDIQPPPSMMNMVENMMGMMGGGGGGMGGGGMPGINPAMMQAAMAQMGGGGF
jgi:hypothetical protein